jgi:hypothetical protein
MSGFVGLCRVGSVIARLVARAFETHVPCHPLSTASQKSLSHCSRSKHAAGEPAAKRATSMICRPSVPSKPPGQK